MNNDRILVVGSSHLSYRVQKQLVSSGYDVTYLPKEKFESKDTNISRFEFITSLLKNTGIESVRMAYILDDNDDFNLEIIIVLISLNDKLNITASLFNENIGPHLRAAHPNINILNPAKIAAPKFVEALYMQLTRFLRYELPKRITENKKVKSDNLILLLVGLFAVLILSSVMFFHFSESLTYIDSLYFVIVTVATVGYGDISLLHSTDISKLVDVGLILGSTLFIWLIFSLTVDSLIKKREQLAMGRKHYSYKDHVIICGLGRLGFFIAECLIAKGEKIVIIEKNIDSPHIDYFKKQNIDVYIGDARLPQVLQDVNVVNSKAVMSVINNDYSNLEIGLNARSFDPKIRLILRIFDESMSQNIKENLDIQLALSMSAIADEHFISILKSA